MFLSFDGTKSHYVENQNICGLPCLQKMAGFILEELKRNKKAKMVQRSTLQCIIVLIILWNGTLN